MNIHRAYISLAIFYSLLIVVGAIALLSGGGTILAPIQLGVGLLAVIGLWGYFLKRGFLNPRIWRPLSGLLAVGVVLQLAALFTTSPSNTEMTWLLASAVFSALLIVILYRYGERDQDLWASPEEIEGGRVLGELLAERRELVVEKQEADRQASVKVVKAGSEYHASVIRRQGEGEERFEERFFCPSTLAFFIEKFTCITVRDFAQKYSGPGASPS